MPILLPCGLPAYSILKQEGFRVFPLQERRSSIKIALLNLMPDKVKTETQIARVLSYSPLLVELILLTTASYQAKTVPQHHLKSFYTTWDKIHHQKFHGLIITGAPIEHLKFEDIAYWKEFTMILEWSVSHTVSLLTLCWSAQATLYYWYNINKYMLNRKMFGVYTHTITKPHTPIVQGFNDRLDIPVSRYSEVRRSDVIHTKALDIVVESDKAGLCLLEDNLRKRFFIFNHLEYDTITLQEEYQRDLVKQPQIAIPDNYFPYNDQTYQPINLWRSSGFLFFSNWIHLLSHKGRL